VLAKKDKYVRDPITAIRREQKTPVRKITMAAATITMPLSAPDTTYA
jgi:hypothetical protein